MYRMQFEIYTEIKKAVSAFWDADGFSFICGDISFVINLIF